MGMRCCVISSSRERMTVNKRDEVDGEGEEINVARAMCLSTWPWRECVHGAGAVLVLRMQGQVRGPCRWGGAA